MGIAALLVVDCCSWECGRFCAFVVVDRLDL